MSQEDLATFAQCFHCKDRVAVKDAEQIRTQNQRLRIRGTCSNCGNSVSGFIKDPEHPPLTQEEKKEREEKRRQERKTKSASDLGVQDKKAGKKRSLKPCSHCQCVAHSALVQEAPKKKRRISLKEKREKEIQELKEQITFLRQEQKEDEEEEVSSGASE